MHASTVNIKKTIVWSGQLCGPVKDGEQGKINLSHVATFLEDLLSVSPRFLVSVSVDLAWLA